MLHFLRRIRRSLINTGATRKYLLYAVGEILLVMIGILLALQVNNWNLKRIEKDEENKVVRDLQLEFHRNLRLLEEYDIPRIKRVLSAQEELLEFGINNTEEYTIEVVDSLLSSGVMRHPTWNPSLMVLEDLKNSGRLSKISNEKLKLLLYDWFSFYTDYLEDIESSEEASRGITRYFHEKGNSFVLFGPVKINSDAPNINHNLNQSLVKSIVFVNLLNNLNNIYERRKRAYLDAVNIIGQIIEQCELSIN
jgi:hypothetical protein